MRRCRWPDRFYLADGGTFQAALLSGAIAAQTGGTVLLTAGDVMPQETRAWLDANPDVPAIAVGDPAIAAAPDAEAIPGADPATLSVAVARAGWGASPEEVFLASSTVFADGLTGGPLAAVATPASVFTAGGPLLLTDPAVLDAPIAAYLAEIAPGVARAGVFGGPAAVGDDVLVNASIALGG